MKKTFLIPLFFILSMVIGCRHDPDIPTSPILTYENDIKQIISNNCATAGCHDASGRKRALTTYSEVMHYVSNGKPYSSELFTVIVKLSGDKMPPQGPLSDLQIRSIYIWILQGAKEK
jgi:hypothetical protein